LNMGQTLLTLGMLILLITCVISANRMLIENSEMQYRSEVLKTSSVIANDLFGEISSKPFDQKVTVDTTASVWVQDQTGAMLTMPADTNKLTVYGKWPWGVRRLISLPDSLRWSVSLGKWYYLSQSSLKDIDDYDGYTRKVYYPTIPSWNGPILRADSSQIISYPNYYSVSVKVYYVDYVTQSYLLPDNNTTTRGVFKKIEITITQSYLTNPVVYTSIVSY
jgi:hypothetical protein